MGTESHNDCKRSPTARSKSIQARCFPRLYALERDGKLRSEPRLSENNRKAKFYVLTPLGRKQLEREEQRWAARRHDDFECVGGCVTIVHRLRTWFLWVFQRQRLERSLDDDLQEYVQHSAADKVRDGLSPEQAIRAARMELNGVEQTKERVRSVLSPATLDACMKDVRFALRMMASNRMFTALCVLCLALGIGANATIFSFMESILFRSLPIEEPRSMVVLSWRMSQPPSPDSPSPIRLLRGVVTADGAGARGLVWPYPAFEMFQAEEGVFANLLGQQSVNGLLVDGGAGGLADGTYVTGEYFQDPGSPVVAGRALTMADDRLGAEPAIVLSSAFSRERFGRAETAVGRSIRLDDVAFTVVGVTPPQFFGLDPARSPDFFIPVHIGSAAAIRGRAREWSRDVPGCSGLLADGCRAVAARNEPGPR